MGITQSNVSEGQRNLLGFSRRRKIFSALGSEEPKVEGEKIVLLAERKNPSPVRICGGSREKKGFGERYRSRGSPRVGKGHLGPKEKILGQKEEKSWFNSGR